MTRMGSTRRRSTVSTELLYTYSTVADTAGSASDLRGDLWPTVDALLARTPADRVRLHGLGPLEARRRNLEGTTVPKMLATEARMAGFAMLCAARP